MRRYIYATYKGEYGTHAYRPGTSYFLEIAQRSVPGSWIRVRAVQGFLYRPIPEHEEKRYNDFIDLMEEWDLVKVEAPSTEE